MEAAQLPDLTSAEGRTKAIYEQVALALKANEMCVS